MKLHLTAKVPNEGARLLAQWVMKRHGGDLMKASDSVIISPIVIQRIVAGEMVPGMTVGTNLHRVVGINARDYQRVARQGWFDIGKTIPQAVAA